MRTLVSLRCCFIFLTVLLLWSMPAIAVGNVHVIDDFTGLGVTVENPDTVAVDVVDSKLAVSLVCSDRKPRLIRIPIKRNVKDKKMRITISGDDRIPYMGKFETSDSGELLLYSEERYSLDFQKRPIYFSLDNKYHEDLTFWFKCRGVKADVTPVIYVEKIEFVRLQYTDDRDFAYILAAILMLLFLLPGFLAHCVMFEGGEKEKLLAWLTPLSIFSFLILYIVLYLSQKWSTVPESGLLLTAYIALNFLLVAWLGVRKRLNIVVSNLLLIRFELLAVFIVILGVAAIVTKGLDLPLYTLPYQKMRYFTYGAFGAHDTVFQYVNGISILHAEPFSKYYDDFKLLYDVQDRGIIGGVIYAVMRGIASPLSSDIAYSYGFYTLFGSALNSLVLLPLFALHKYFYGGKQRPLLIMFLISASAFIVTNYFLTWFKLAGAGLIISGIVVLLIDKSSFRPWVMAGILWGLAANFHPSLALSLPVLTIWLLYRYWHECRRRLLPVLYAGFSLISIFVAMNVPWTVVKATHYGDSNRLFREHFLASQPYDEERGMLGTIMNFADRYSFDEQLSERMTRLVKSFRVEEIGSLIESSSSETWEEVLIRWNLIEAAYSVYVLAPLFVLVLISSLLTRFCPATRWGYPLTNHTTDFRWLLITQVISIFLVIIISFGKNSPDLTWNIPMSCLAVALYLLVHWNFAIGKIGAAVIIVYSLFTHYRLFFQYF